MYFSRFFIEAILPAHVTDSDAFRRFLNYLNPEFKVPSRRKLTRDIDRMGDKTKSSLTSLLSQVDHVATTGKIFTFVTIPYYCY